MKHWSRAVVLKLEQTSVSPGGLLKYRLQAPPPGYLSQSWVLPENCISNKFPGDTDAGGHLENPGLPFADLGITLTQTTPQPLIHRQAYKQMSKTT